MRLVRVGGFRGGRGLGEGYMDRGVGYWFVYSALELGLEAV